MAATRPLDSVAPHPMNDVSWPPRRTVESTLEAPDLPNSVLPLAASAHHSRLGPVVGWRGGVFQTACSGKYHNNDSNCTPPCDEVSHCQTPTHASCCDGPNSAAWTLGRAVESIMEAPRPSNSVAPTAAIALHSRPGPVVGCGRGVFQHIRPGEFSSEFVREHHLPDISANFRNRRRPAVQRDQGISIYYQNVGGLNSSVLDYQLATSDRCFDIIALTETWLDTRTLSNQVFGSEYEVFRCDRSPNNSRKTTGGGVLIAVSADMKARVVESEQWNSVEQIWTAVKLADRTLFLCAVYFPPDRVRDCSLIDAHYQSVMSIMDRATAVDEIIIIGDYNLPGISWRPFHSGFLQPDLDCSVFHAGATALLDSYSAATLSQINHVTNENNRSLDLCFVSSRDVAPVITIAPAPLVKLTTHHPPLIITVDSKRVSDFAPFPRSVSYDFRRADHRSITELLLNVNWEAILDPTDAEAAALTFSHVLAHAIERHVPKKVHRHSVHAPWQTSELRSLKTIKRAAFRKFSRHRTLQLRDHYVRLNYEYKRMSRQCYSRYQHSIQRRLKSHPKQFWKYVNDQRKESGLPSTMTLDDVTVSTTQEICQLFATKFASVFTNEHLTAGQVSLAANNVPLQFQSMSTIDVDAAMINQAAAKLKSSFNPGPDGIPSAFLKKHIDAISRPLVHVFQLSITSGTFPSCWKLAHMFPVHKKGNKRDIDNYRGISSLSAVSKLFELVVMEPLLSHCQQYLSEDQHGFMAGRSTTTNLLCLTSHVLECMAERFQTDVIYTDLSAAFDTLNHDIAIAKLGRLGICDGLLSWFKSYLINRHLTVAIGDCQSADFSATSGIPQGSHLGPLIFLLYFNDVNIAIKGPRLSYADDLKIYFRIRSIADCHFLQGQLQAFVDWCHLNRMVVNPTKCSVISFSRKKDPLRYSYSLSGTVIERVSHIKDLGVILDSQLTFKQHISYIVDKASRTLGFIFRIAKGFSDIYCLKALYCSLVRSTLEYCSAVWNPNYQNSVDRIESVQRRFLRFALRKLPWRDPFRLPSYRSRCQLIQLEPLDTRRDTARALLVADVLQGRIDCPAILEQINFNVQPRALRNNVMLRLPRLQTNYGMYGAINGLQRVFNRVTSAFDFNLSRQTLRVRFMSIFSGRSA